MQQISPWFPEYGTVSLATWVKVGQQLHNKSTAEGPQTMPVYTFAMWSLIRDALDPQHEADKIKDKLVTALSNTPRGVQAILKARREVKVPRVLSLPPHLRTSIHHPNTYLKLPSLLKRRVTDKA